MKKILFPLLTALLLATLPAAAQKGSNAPDHAMKEIQGNVKFLAYSHYNCKRNADGDYVIDRSPIHFDDVFMFTKDGYFDGPFSGIYSVEFAEGDRTIWKRFRNPGKHIEKWNNHSVAVTRDNEGYITEIEIDGIEHWQFRWDKKKRRITKQYGVVPAGDGPGTIIVEIEYDEKGWPVKRQRTFPEMDMEVRTDTYVYGSADDLGNWKDRVTITTDDDGNEIDLYYTERTIKYF